MNDPYIAGLFDGEGSVAIYRHKQGTTYSTFVRVQIGQMKSEASQNLFQELQARFGGSISEQRKRKGSKYLIYQLSRRKAIPFLEAIAPYSILKLPQIQAVLAWTESAIPYERGRDDSKIVQLLSDLKRPWRDTNAIQRT